jgi:hypothetical protein
MSIALYIIKKDDISSPFWNVENKLVELGRFQGPCVQQFKGVVQRTQIAQECKYFTQRKGARQM